MCVPWPEYLRISFSSFASSGSWIRTTTLPSASVESVTACTVKSSLPSDNRGQSLPSGLEGGGGGGRGGGVCVQRELRLDNPLDRLEHGVHRPHTHGRVGQLIAVRVPHRHRRGWRQLVAGGNVDALERPVVLHLGQLLVLRHVHQRHEVLVSHDLLEVRHLLELLERRLQLIPIELNDFAAQQTMVRGKGEVWDGR